VIFQERPLALDVEIFLLLLTREADSAPSLVSFSTDTPVQRSLEGSVPPVALCLQGPWCQEHASAWEQHLCCLAPCSPWLQLHY